jgi:hypothetical protein
MPTLLRIRLEIEEVAGQASAQITEGDIREAMDGAFETYLSESQAESIDELESALVRAQFEVSRRVLARHLARLAQKKLDEQRLEAAASCATRYPIELTVKLADIRSTLIESRTTRGW